MGGMGLSTDLIDSEALCDILEMIILEGKSSDLLDLYAKREQRHFRCMLTLKVLRINLEPKVTLNSPTRIGCSGS